MTYEIVKGLKPPECRKARRSKLPQIIALAKRMEIGDGAVLGMSDAQQLRVVLLALGYGCVSDASQSPDRTKLMVFKVYDSLGT